MKLELVGKLVAIQSSAKFEAKAVKTSEGYRDMLNEDESFWTEFGETKMRNKDSINNLWQVFQQALDTTTTTTLP